MGGNKKAIISAFNLQPEILQIADIVTIAPEDGVKPSYPELAKVKDNNIVVEPYLQRNIYKFNQIICFMKLYFKLIIFISDKYFINLNKKLNNIYAFN